MDHAEALERIEIAAVEPDGLERLMAGDTPESAAVAGHLAGCAACADELARIGRVAAVARSVIAEAPDPALKGRTLAYVKANGIDRTPAVRDLKPDDLAPAAAAPSGVSPVDFGSSTAPVGPSGTSPAPVVLVPRRRVPLAWLAGIAAALLVVGIAGYGLGGGFVPDASHDDSATAVLADVATTALDLASVPGTEVVALTATAAGGDASGRLAFNGGSGDLVMVATGLDAPAAGAVYGCWVEADGERRRLGTMYAAGDNLWAWSGAAEGLDALPAGTVFGVSLVPAGAGAGEPVLTGTSSS